MKKFLASLVVIFALIFVGGRAWYQASYGGQTYYVQIKGEGQRKTDTDSKGKVYGSYEYTLDGKDKSGNSKSLTFRNIEDRPMKQDAWLKITYNKDKGVTSWNEVSPSQVPDKAK
ncbi:YxeA family protein [Streptococcaceae bacterium ESL0729]|nr:YxeA family protein [Streptococcaceae bacterium ESL0729]